jgi:hypothetical protein
MEFRIAPMIMVVFNVLYISLANPYLNDWIPLKDLANYAKVLGPFLLIFVLSMGAFLRHSYYSKWFKGIFISLSTISVLMAIIYIFAIEQQNL